MKFYDNKKRKNVTYQNVQEPARSTIFPKICKALRFKMSVKANNNITLTKIFSRSDKKERQLFKEAKEILREERRKTYGPDFARILKAQGINGYSWDIKVLEEETKMLRMQRGEDTDSGEEELPDRAEEELKGSDLKQAMIDNIVNAAPIDSENKGHCMLRSMGWKQGEKLGVNQDEMLQPLVVKTLRRGRGLGSH